MSSIDWTNVLVALISGLPAIIAAIGVILVRQQIKTPSGKTIGSQVEASHHTAIANNHRLVSITDKVDAVTPAVSISEEAKVPDLPNGTT
jgi:hypothetical protein